jgi:uracil-DNA glycosylase family 4
MIGYTTVTNNCIKCPLHKKRLKLFFPELIQSTIGRGNTTFIILPAPSSYDEKRGYYLARDFDKCLREELKLLKGNIVLSSLLKCNPGSSANINQEYIRTCSPFLIDELNYYQPLFVIAVGSVVTNFFIEGGVSDKSGIIQSIIIQFSNGRSKKIKLIPLIHPSSLVDFNRISNQKKKYPSKKLFPDTNFPKNKFLKYQKNLPERKENIKIWNKSWVKIGREVGSKIDKLNVNDKQNLLNFLK